MTEAGNVNLAFREDPPSSGSLHKEIAFVKANEVKLFVMHSHQLNMFALNLGKIMTILRTRQGVSTGKNADF